MARTKSPAPSLESILLLAADDEDRHRALVTHRHRAPWLRGLGLRASTERLLDTMDEGALEASLAAVIASPLARRRLLAGGVSCLALGLVGASGCKEPAAGDPPPPGLAPSSDATAAAPTGADMVTHQSHEIIAPGATVSPQAGASSPTLAATETPTPTKPVLFTGHMADEPTSSVTLEATVAAESPTAKAIGDEIIGERLPYLKTCGTRLAKVGTHTITVVMKVGGGMVQSITLASGEPPESAFEKCITKRLGMKSFSAYQAPSVFEVTLTYQVGLEP